MDPACIPELSERLRTHDMTRIVAFGSSNTAHRTPTAARPHWLDWLDIGIVDTLWRVHHVINAGIGGETTRELIGRFDRDVAWYRPDIVIVTIGGNDSNPGPERNLSPDEFAENLRTIVASIQGLPGGCIPVLQTYYSADLDAMDPAHAERFPRYMQIVRDVAAETDAALIDHLRRWERLRTNDLDAYRALMLDPMHVNPLGNMLLGLDCLRAFGFEPTEWIRQTCQPGIALQQTIDALEER